MADRKAVIKNADMSEEMQQDAVDSATAALEKFNIEKASLLHFCIMFIFKYCTQRHDYSALKSTTERKLNSLTSCYRT